MLASAVEGYSRERAIPVCVQSEMPLATAELVDHMVFPLLWAKTERSLTTAYMFAESSITNQ